MELSPGLHTFAGAMDFNGSDEDAQLVALGWGRNANRCRVRLALSGHAQVVGGWFAQNRFGTD